MSMTCPSVQRMETTSSSHWISVVSTLGSVGTMVASVVVVDEVVLDVVVDSPVVVDSVVDVVVVLLLLLFCCCCRFFGDFFILRTHTPLPTFRQTPPP